MFCEIMLDGDGAAFQTSDDLAEVLLEVRNRIKAGEEEGNVHDFNGNLVGTFVVGEQA